MDRAAIKSSTSISSMGLVIFFMGIGVYICTAFAFQTSGINFSVGHSVACAILSLIPFLLTLFNIDLLEF